MNEPVTVGKTHYKTLIKHKQTNFPGTLPLNSKVYSMCVWENRIQIGENCSFSPWITASRFLAVFKLLSLRRLCAPAHCTSCPLENFHFPCSRISLGMRVRGMQHCLFVVSKYFLSFFLRDFGAVRFPGAYPDPDTGCVCLGRLRSGSQNRCRKWKWK